MKQFKAKFYALYFKVVNSIGFYPALISFIYFLCAIGILILDFSNFGADIKEEFIWLSIKNDDTARAILSTLIGGIISLTVLSFSMVMIVLTQAFAHLTPKLILGLVAEKTHQRVLGNYIGAIIYALVVLITVRSDGLYAIPSISVLWSIVIGIWCLALFVYFIDHISRSIQVNNIAENIFRDTKGYITNLKDKREEKEWEEKYIDIDDFDLPETIFSRKTGFLQSINPKRIAELAKEHDLVIKFTTATGNFVVEKTPLFKCNKDLEQSAPDIVDKIYTYINFYSGEKISENYAYGFTQLSEIAVKALSPGINDPGTASICIDYLTDLFRLKMTLREQNAFKDENGKIRVLIKILDFEELFNKCITPIRQYAQKDIAIARDLLCCINTLSYFDKDERKWKDVLEDQAKGILDNIKDSIHNHSDKKAINSILKRMNKSPQKYFRLELL